ncbi:MAG TPA: response regulator transcription factor [Alphaproteobacteria bacterium]|nr:response regulator transcription factor [Alphaproteobacteria bacterium]
MDAKPDSLENPPIIFVEDDDFFREITTQNLRDSGFQVVGFDRGVNALKYFREGGTAQLALLDWKLPTISGMELFRLLRQEKVEIPTIFLTSLSGSVYEETALKNGAADFIDKTRSFTILLSRINSALSTGRQATIRVVPPPAAQPSYLEIGELELDTASNRAFWKKQLINLTLAEFRIVHQMASNAGRDMSHRKIYDTVRGEGFIAGDGADGYRSNVRTFIKRIRQKFCDADADFNRIATYSGFGYRWLGD